MFFHWRTAAGADVQPGGQVEKHFARDARCPKKKDRAVRYDDIYRMDEIKNLLCVPSLSV